MKIVGLKTNYQINPLGIEIPGVTFSWKVKEARGKFQEWARLLISEDRAFETLVYDSGERELNSCGFAPEAELHGGCTYYWKVTVRDDAGEEAESDVAFFEGGHPEGEWHGSWIKPPFVQEIHPVFRKCFSLDGWGQEGTGRARLYVCGLGLYEVYINGQKAGEDYLAPYWTDYRHWIQYQTYDVGKYLQAGENQIDIYLGNGWYKGVFGYTNQGILRNFYGDSFKLLADLYVRDEAGRETVVATDETWMALKSPVISSGIYDGEMYDSRMEKDLVEIPDRKRLFAAKAEAPRGRLCPMTGVPVRRREVLPVKEIIRTDIGETVLDFGQEITGWVAFQAEGPRDRRIILEYGEVMQNGRFYRDNLRTAQAKYTFISDGRKQFARPHFTFFGFRYVKVTGMEVNESNVGEFEAWALYSDIEETGFIETSHEKVNRLISNTKWSQKDNFLDVPTDCPQRDERCGWTGDAEIFSGAASFHMETPAFFRKYLKDMALEQREKGGAVPYVVPDILTLVRQMNGEPEFNPDELGWGEAGSCVWGDAASIIPWNMYLHYGNKKWLEEQYDNMKQWVDFIITMDEKYCGGRRLWTCGFHFGDWLSLDAQGEDNREGGTDRYFVASAFYMYSARLTAKAAEVIGREKDAKYYGEIASQVRRAIREYYMTSDGKLTIHTQTAYALGIRFGLFEDTEKEAAGRELKGLLDKFGGHLATGFVGTAYLCDALTETGYLDEAYGLLLNEEYPGWLFEVNLGATTIWERWNSLLPDGSISSTGMNSLNHYAYGVIVEWIYREVCGIRHREDGVGGKRMLLAPKPGRQLEFAHGVYRSAAGDYECGWKWEGDRLTYTFQVPFDCRAAFVPGIVGETVTVNGVETDRTALGKEFVAGRYVVETIVS